MFTKMEWSVEFVGKVDIRNAVWYYLTDLRVYRNGVTESIPPQHMKVGEIGTGLFSSGMGLSSARVERLA